MSDIVLRNYRAPEDGYHIKHRLKTEARLLIPYEVWDRMMYFIDRMSIECQWFNCIDRITDLSGNPTTIDYRLSDMFIPHQKAAAQDVECDATEKHKMWEEIKNLRGLELKEIGDLQKRGSFWGHSHVHMPPRPSKTDDEAWATMVESSLRARLSAFKVSQPAGMIIFNKQGAYTARVYEPELDLEFFNPKVLLEDNRDLTYIDDAIDNKVKKYDPPKPIVVQTTSYASTISAYQANKPGGQTTDPKAIAPLSEVRPSGDSKSNTASTTSPKLTEISDEFTVEKTGHLSNAEALSIKEALINLRKNVALFFQKPKPLNEICDAVNSLDGYTGKETRKIGDKINFILGVLNHNGKRFSTAVNELSTAVELLWTIRRAVGNQTPSREIEMDLLNTLNTHVGSIDNIKSFFESDHVEHPEVLLFAIAIAKTSDLLSTPNSLSQAENIRALAGYCGRLADVYSFVLKKDMEEDEHPTRARR